MRLRLSLALASLILLAPSPAADAQGLSLGFSNDNPIVFSDTWMKRAVLEQADIVRIGVVWSAVAPRHRPRGFDPSNPSSPGYDWSSVDQRVRSLADHGIQPLLNLTFAPGWAEGRSAPRGSVPGTWRPSPSQYAAFARAAARRFSGHYPDPARPGEPLPRVRLWQAWNEPNLSGYLSPQWSPTRTGYVPTGAFIYRQLLNGFYASVKSVSASNVVVAAGTAPYGDPPGGPRMQPVPFYRSLFCFSNTGRLTPINCPDPVHLDAVSTHPYGIGGPLWQAINPGDVAVPDVYKIVGVLHAAERRHRVLGGGAKRVWVTETSWDSSPPDPQGIPVQQHARWLEQALYVLWRQGVDTVLWLELEDDPCVPNCGATYQAGLYYMSGRPKPAAQAFRFPFVTNRLNRSHIQLWGRAPLGGTLEIQALRGGRWTGFASFGVKPRSVFLKTVAESGPITLRAVLRKASSLSWHQG